MIRAVLFDLGNVLIGLDHATGFQRFQRWCPLSPVAILQALTDSGLERAFNCGEIEPPVFFQRLAAVLKLDPACDFPEFRACYTGIFRARPEMGELVESLAGRCHTGILSNTDIMHWQMAREQFSYVKVPAVRVLSYEVGLMKPDPAIYRLAATRLGVEPQEIFFTDDLPVNIAGAQAAGLHAVLFTGHEQLRADLADCGIG